MEPVAAEILAILLTLTGIGASSDCTSELPSPAAYLLQPYPGDFFGNTTLPSLCLNAGEGLVCIPQRVPIFDDSSGATAGSVNSSEFLAWNEDSVLVIFGGDNALNSLRQINLYFYHDPASGIGLPEFNLTVSGNDVVPGDPLTYTILNNQDLTVDDAQVRNVTLAFTEPTPAIASNIHIGFSLTSSIQQFAISEVQLCSDEATIEGETLTVEVISDPLDGPDILIPANRTVIDGNTIRLSCTVANQGRFEWEWLTPRATSPQVSDGTRTSRVEIPLESESMGRYICVVRYHPETHLEPSASAGSATVNLEQLLFTDMDTIDITELTSVMLKCTLAGYGIDAEQISWSFNGQPITSGTDNYLISVSSIDCPPYGTCGLGLLAITDLDGDDAGEYVCSFNNLSQTVTLTDAEGTSLPDPVQTPSTANSQTPLVAGLTVGCVIILTLVTVIVVASVVCFKRYKSSMDTKQETYAYVADPQPPPLPERIQLKGNDAYGNKADTLQTNEPLSIQPNITYGMVQPASQDYTLLEGSMQANVAYEFVTPPIKDDSGKEGTSAPEDYDYEKPVTEKLMDNDMKD